MSEGQEGIIREEEPSVTDLVPVMRKHLWEGLVAIDLALSKSVAEDMVESFRQNLTQTVNSPYTNQLTKGYNSLIQYIGESDDDETSAAE